MLENQTVKERLIAYIQYLGIGQGKFEASCGLANGYVNNIRKSITPEKLQIIARQYPELNTGWLMTGEGNMLRPTIEQKIGDVKDSELHEVNVVKGDPDAYNALLRIVEAHQETTKGFLETTNGFQRNIEKFQEQIDRLLNLLEAKK